MLLNSAQALFIRTKQLSASTRDNNNLQELLTSELQEKGISYADGAAVPCL